MDQDGRYDTDATRNTLKTAARHHITGNDSSIFNGLLERNNVSGPPKAVKEVSMVSLLAGTGACVLGRHLVAGSDHDKWLGRLQASLMLIATFAALATAETIAQTIALRVGDPGNYFASWSATSCKRSFAPIAA